MASKKTHSSDRIYQQTIGGRIGQRIQCNARLEERRASLNINRYDRGEVVRPLAKFGYIPCCIADCKKRGIYKTSTTIGGEWKYYCYVHRDNGIKAKTQWNKQHYGAA